MLDSTDCDFVTELVGALKVGDLLAIHEGEHNPEGAKQRQQFAAMLLVCVLAEVIPSLLLCFAHFCDSFVFIYNNDSVILIQKNFE